MLGAMDCPFCDELATMQPPQGYDGDILDCPKYGRVKIARSALNRLKAMNLDGRIGALTKAQAKAEPGAVPEISGFEV